MSERLREGLQLRNKREKGDRPLKGKDQAEREEPSPTRSRREDDSKRTSSHRVPRESSGRGRSLTRRRRRQAQKTTCRQEAEQVDLEADPRPGEHNGENQEPPTTLSYSEDHPARGRQRLQGASRATDRGTKPQPAEVGQGTQDNPRPSARVMEATLNPNMGQGRTLEGVKDNRSSLTQRGPPGNTP